MTRARKALISLDDTPYYHCISRCVRRAFLCGEDRFSGNSYEHRRKWVVERLKILSSIFAIDIAAYTVLSNHYHVVLRVDRQRANDWSALEVIERWQQLFSGPELIQRYRDNPQDFSVSEREVVDAIVALWRERLTDISWFMRCLNEHLARKANREDRCKGRFWEGRFKSQALLDDTALLACMAYVDLNPIRAGIAATPEQSDFTSLQERLGIAPEPITTPKDRGVEPGPASDEAAPSPLLPFAENLTEKTPDLALPFRFADYLELVDWTGRAILENKRGSIPGNAPPILQRLGIDSAQWLKASASLEQQFGYAVGPEEKLLKLCERLKQKWLQGVVACRQLYLPTKSPT